MAKKIILIFLGVFVLAVGGLTAYVSTIDWNTHRQEIADKFSEITGKKIEFSGPISVELLPQPTLSAKNIKIINPNKTSEVLAAIDSLDTKVSLRSLLKGSPDIRSLSLIGAEVWVSVDEAGEWNWKSNSAGVFNDSNINTRLQSLSIQNALVHFENAAENIKFDLSQFNADIQAETLAGPYRLDGNFIKNQDHFGVAVSLGSFSGLADVAVNFAITHPKSESFLRFDGVYMPNEQAYKGDFSGGSKQTADFANVLMGMKVLDDVYNVPLQFSVGIESGSEQIKLSSFIIKYDNLIEGAGSLIIPLRAEQGENRTVNLKYQLVNLDLRPLLSILKAEYKSFEDNGSVYKPDFNINIDADISSERVALNDSDTGSLESVSLKGSWRDNVLSLDEFYAACAGNTVLNMEGSLVEEKQSPQYFLKVSVDSKDFLAFLNSMGLQLQSYTQATYRNAQVSFSLSGNNSALSANDIKFLMDKMNITGVAGVTFKDNGNLYELQLAADTLNLNNYLPKKENEADFMTNLKEDNQNLSFLKWLNMHAKLRAGNLMFRKASMENVYLQIDAENGKIHLTDASAENMLDTNFKLKADIDNIGTLDVVFKDLTFDVQSNNLENVKNTLKLPWPNWKIFAAQKFAATGTYNGDLHSGVLKVSGSTDDTKIEYEGEVKQDEEFMFDGKLALKTTNFGEFAGSIGGSFKNAAGILSALNCSSTLSGKVSSWKFTDADCLLGVAKYSGAGEINKIKNNYDIKAKIDVDDFNLENVTDVQAFKNSPAINRLQENNFLSRPDFNADTFVFDIYRNLGMDIDLTAAKAYYSGTVFNNLRVHILNSDNILRLENLSAEMNDVKAKGNLQINYIQSPVVKGHLQFDNIDLKNLGGNIYKFADGTLTAEGTFEMTAASVSEFVNNYTGDVKFAGNDVAFEGFDFAAIEEDLKDRKYSKGLFQKIRDSLQSGQTGFSTFSAEAKFDRGVLNYQNFEMANDTVNIQGSGTADVSEWKMNNSFEVVFANLPKIPPFSFSLSGLINKLTLDLNIEKLARKYDEHWEQLEAQEQEQRAEKARQLGQKMADVQQAVIQIADYVNGFVPEIEEHKSKSRNVDEIAWYQSKLDRISKVNKNLDDMKGKAHLPDFTEADVQNISDTCLQLEDEFKPLKSEITAHYAADVKQRFADLGQTIASMDAKRFELAQKYQQLLQDKFDELLKLGMPQQMVDNQEIKNYQTEMNLQNDKAGIQYDAILKKQNDIQPDNIEISDLENKTADLQNEVDKYETDYQAMQQSYEKTESLLNEIVAAQQKIYDEKMAKKKAEEQAEENAENMDGGETEKTADTKTSPKYQLPVIDVKENHIEDQAPKMTVEIKADEPKRPTLRKITEETVDTKVSGTIKKSYEKSADKPAVPTSGRLLLKEVDGAVQKPTGTIVVK